MTRLIRITAACTILVCASVSLAVAQDTLASARQLYGSASYDEALGVLERLKTAAPSGSSDVRDIEEYRALCLLALGRQADAEKAIETLVTLDPTFRPDETAVSPRVMSAFDQVRRRIIPNVAQQRYLTAKAAFDKKDYQPALDGFDAVLKLINAPDLGTAVQEPPLSDLRTLVTGFRDLARAAIPPPADPPAPPPPVVPASPPAPVIYTGDDPNVTPPVVVSQSVPPWPLPTATSGPRWGILEIIVSETGAPEAVRLTKSIAGFYDDQLVAAAKRWKFKPATKDGQPVKFRYLTRVTVTK
jgi:hypothetical protein